jgi:UDP-N-acetylmuramoyl-tripeptide--D-alanyl-D-alanine ligase
MFTIDDILAASGGALVRKPSASVFSGVSIDTRTIRPNEIFTALSGNNFDGHDFLADAARKGAGLLIVQKGKGSAQLKKLVFRGAGRCKSGVLEVEDTLRTLGKLAAFKRMLFDIPVVAVTGSNGKTTTKEMLSWILGDKYCVLKNEGTKNNHIGVPMTLLGLRSCHEAAVVELGSNHFGEIEYLADIVAPTVGIITNIGPSHLEFFQSLDGVCREKTSMLAGLKHPSIGILNADDPFLQPLIAKGSCEAFFLGFGHKHAAEFRVTRIVPVPGGFSFSINNRNTFVIRTPGRHNVYNAAAAIAAAKILGVTDRNIFRRLKSFVPLKGRMHMVTVGKVRFIDDSYNANPLSLQHALDALGSIKTHGRKIMVLGDMLELGHGEDKFHIEAGGRIADIADIFVAVGRKAMLAAEAAVSRGMDKRCVYNCRSSSQAKDVLFGRLELKKDDLVLLKGSRGMKLDSIIEKK